MEDFDLGFFAVEKLILDFFDLELRFWGAEVVWVLR